MIVKIILKPDCDYVVVDKNNNVTFAVDNEKLGELREGYIPLAELVRLRVIDFEFYDEEKTEA